MTTRDLANVAELLSMLPDLYPNGDQWLQRRLRDVVDKKASCDVSLLDGELAGVAITTPKSYGVVKISTLYVADWARRRGVASNLVDGILRRADDAAVAEIYITVAHHVAPNLEKLLEPRGFSRSALELDRYGTGRHEVILTRIGGPSNGPTVS